MRKTTNDTRSTTPARRSHPRRPDKALAFLASLASEFTAVLNLNQLVDRVLESLRAQVGFDSCTIGLLDERAGDCITVVGAAGLRVDFRGLVIPRGHGLHWAVMDAAGPLYVPDMQADLRVFRRDVRVRSGIYAPLIVHGRPIGVLSAHRSAVAAFTQGELDLLTVVARYLTGAFEVARLHEQFRVLAATDTLTGLSNRRAFITRLESELDRSRRAGRSFSLALVDVDGFKEINDTYGHAVGDAALIKIAGTFKRSIRAYDLAARFGGDEFVFLFPDTAATLGETVLRRLMRQEISVGETGGSVLLTLSWGIAAWPDDSDDPLGLIRAADARLYAKKREQPHAQPAKGHGPQKGSLRRTRLRHTR
ncbi:MAG TPA: sensor domain-containing diguanylate cyclase [bacterium]|nr:sensor domain-containing diguanylate cyclase [bacterium]